MPKIIPFDPNQQPREAIIEESVGYILGLHDVNEGSSFLGERKVGLVHYAKLQLALADRDGKYDLTGPNMHLFDDQPAILRQNTLSFPNMPTHHVVGDLTEHSYVQMLAELRKIQDGNVILLWDWGGVGESIYKYQPETVRTNLDGGEYYDELNYKLTGLNEEIYAELKRLQALGAILIDTSMDFDHVRHCYLLYRYSGRNASEYLAIEDYDKRDPTVWAQMVLTQDDRLRYNFNATNTLTASTRLFTLTKLLHKSSPYAGEIFTFVENQLESIAVRDPVTRRFLRYKHDFNEAMPGTMIAAFNEHFKQQFGDDEKVMHIASRLFIALGHASQCTKGLYEAALPYLKNKGDVEGWSRDPYFAQIDPNPGAYPAKVEAYTYYAENTLNKIIAQAFHRRVAAPADLPAPPKPEVAPATSVAYAAPELAPPTYDDTIHLPPIPSAPPPDKEPIARVLHPRTAPPPKEEAIVYATYANSTWKALPSPVKMEVIGYCQRVYPAYDPLPQKLWADGTKPPVEFLKILYDDQVACLKAKGHRPPLHPFSGPEKTAVPMDSAHRFYNNPAANHAGNAWELLNQETQLEIAQHYQRTGKIRTIVADLITAAHLWNIERDKQGILDALPKASDMQPK